MKFILLFLLCSISFSASAQWWKFILHEKLPALPAAHHGLYHAVFSNTPVKPQVKQLTLPPSDFTLEAAQTQMIKTAQHNMRFHIYDLASYNFSDLAQLYVQQRRFSEAKWYFLQSATLSRQQNNNKLTIANLVNLALVKSQIGDFLLAQDDLLEARDIAASKGWLLDVIEIEKKLTYIQRNRMQLLKTDRRYADELTVEN